MSAGCVAKRLTDPAYAVRLEKWHELTGKRFMSILHTAISARLNRLDAFLPFFVANTDWRYSMTAELILSIPLEGGPVDPAVWEAIYERHAARRLAREAKKRQAARRSAALSTATQAPHAAL